MKQFWQKTNLPLLVVQIEEEQNIPEQLVHLFLLSNNLKVEEQFIQLDEMESGKPMISVPGGEKNDNLPIWSPE